MGVDKLLGKVKPNVCAVLLPKTEPSINLHLSQNQGLMFSSRPKW